MHANTGVRQEIDIRLTEDGTEVVRREALMEEKRADVECQKPAKP